MQFSTVLMGASGKVGCRITDQLRNRDGYDISHMEPDDEGCDRLAECGISAAREPDDETLARADAVIMVVPDSVIGD